MEMGGKRYLGAGGGQKMKCSKYSVNVRRELAITETNAVKITIKKIGRTMKLYANKIMKLQHQQQMRGTSEETFEEQLETQEKYPSRYTKMEIAPVSGRSCFLIT
jgi:hypothetical protein